MRGLFLIIILIVLLASGFGVYVAFTIPTEVEEQATLLNYEHMGKFDYLAYVKASYLYDDIHLETKNETNAVPEVTEGPPTTPKYPAEIVDKFDMSFSYWLLPDKELVKRISEQVEIRAVMDKPEIGREEVTLVSITVETGDFTVNFSLDGSELASSSKTVITAYVYATMETADNGPIFESFDQSLTILSRGPHLEVDKNLASTQKASFGELNYEQRGEFDYSIQLEPNSPFGAMTLGPPSPPSPPPPPPPPPPSSKTLGPGDTLFTTLFDSMDVSFSYHFESDWPVKQINEEVEINAVLEKPDVWSKEFVLVPRTEKSGDFVVTFHLDTDDFSYFNDVFRTIERETGDSVPYNITIRAHVHTMAQTSFGPIDEEYIQTLSTTLGGGVLEWNEELEDSKPGAIWTSRMVPNPETFWVLSVAQIRNMSAIVAGVIFILFAYVLVLNVRFKPEKLPYIDEEALRARKKHKDVIVDIEELPEAEAREVVIQLSSLDELIKAADDLLKPVLHKAEAQRHIYCVIDNFTRYEYISQA